MDGYLKGSKQSNNGRTCLLFDRNMCIDKIRFFGKFKLNELYFQPEYRIRFSIISLLL